MAARLWIALGVDEDKLVHEAGAEKRDCMDMTRKLIAYHSQSVTKSRTQHLALAPDNPFEYTVLHVVEGVGRGHHTSHLVVFYASDAEVPTQQVFQVGQHHAII